MNSKNLFAVAALAAFVSAASPPATADDDGSNPCGAVMCLVGEATGHGGGSGCDKYVNPYYQINITDHGVFRPDKTAEARLNYLKGCKTADSNSLQVANTNGGNQSAPIAAPPSTGKPGDPARPCPAFQNCEIP